MTPLVNSEARTLSQLHGWKWLDICETDSTVTNKYPRPEYRNFRQLTVL